MSDDKEAHDEPFDEIDLAEWLYENHYDSFLGLAKRLMNAFKVEKR